jgi:hypothetical protein
LNDGEKNMKEGEKGFLLLFFLQNLKEQLKVEVVA